MKSCAGISKALSNSVVVVDAPGSFEGGDLTVPSGEYLSNTYNLETAMTVK